MTYVGVESRYIFIDRTYFGLLEATEVVSHGADLCVFLKA